MTKMKNGVIVSAALMILMTAVLVPGATMQKTTTTVPLIPLKDFFRNPEKSDFEISPNGEYLAFMQPWEKRMNVFVQKIGSDTAVRVTSAKERDIAGYAWK